MTAPGPGSMYAVIQPVSGDGVEGVLIYLLKTDDIVRSSFRKVPDYGSLQLPAQIVDQLKSKGFGGLVVHAFRISDPIVPNAENIFVFVFFFERNTYFP